MMKLVQTAFLVFLFSLSDSLAGLRIYYMRHAEAGHNAREYWEASSIPEKKWPDFVGDPNAFTPKGLVERDEVARKLRRLEFDYIAVSPMWRARHTILPWIKENRKQVVIWPELHEIYASSMIVSESLPPPPSAKMLTAGREIELPSEEQAWFTLREDGRKYFKLPEKLEQRDRKEEKAAAARFIIQTAIDGLMERFRGSEKTILLVGHGSSGKGILRMLLNDRLSGFPGISNTGIWMVEEQKDGTFQLMIFNDVPIDKAIQSPE